MIKYHGYLNCVIIWYPFPNTYTFMANYTKLWHIWLKRVSSNNLNICAPLTCDVTLILLCSTCLLEYQNRRHHHLVCQLFISWCSISLLIMRYILLSVPAINLNNGSRNSIYESKSSMRFCTNLCDSRFSRCCFMSCNFHQTVISFQNRYHTIPKDCTK